MKMRNNLLIDQYIFTLAFGRDADFHDKRHSCTMDIGPRVGERTLSHCIIVLFLQYTTPSIPATSIP